MTGHMTAHNSSYTNASSARKPIFTRLEAAFFAATCIGGAAFGYFTGELVHPKPPTDIIAGDKNLKVEFTTIRSAILGHVKQADLDEYEPFAKNYTIPFRGSEFDEYVIGNYVSMDGVAISTGQVQELKDGRGETYYCPTYILSYEKTTSLLNDNKSTAEKKHITEVGYACNWQNGLYP